MSQETRTKLPQGTVEATPMEAAEPTGRHYAAPRLTALGDLRGLTFGGSPGVNDSGNLFVQEPPV